MQDGSGMFHLHSAEADWSILYDADRKESCQMYRMLSNLCVIEYKLNTDGGLHRSRDRVVLP